MTPIAETILTYLQKHYSNSFDKRYLVEVLNLPMNRLTPSLRGLCSNGYVKEYLVRESNGEVSKRVQITDEGMKYDSKAEYERQRIEKINARCERRRAKAIENGELHEFYTKHK